MAHFDLLPPRPSWWDAGSITSLILHSALAVQLVFGRPAPETGGDPVEQLVVFLVPPDREVGRQAAGRGVDWSGLVGSGGATEEALTPPDRPEQTIPLGPAGDPVVSEPELPPAPVNEETALTEIEVDSAVVRDPTSAAPVYPPELLAKNVEGSTFVNYVVDTTGSVDTTTIQVIRTTHTEFAQSVRNALALMKFRPAIQASRRVRQWVQQNFAFKIVPPAQPPADSTSPR